MVNLNINIDVKVAKGALEQINRKVPSATRKALTKAGMFIQNAIKDRTRRGVDFKGRTFRPYSPRYAKQRAKEGRTTTPNLFRSGQMLGNMTFRNLSKTKGQIFFPNRQQNLKAFYNDTQGVGNAKVKRKFFAVGKKEEDRAVEIFKKTFERELRV